MLRVTPLRDDDGLLQQLHDDLDHVAAIVANGNVAVDRHYRRPV